MRRKTSPKELEKSGRFQEKWKENLKVCCILMCVLTYSIYGIASPLKTIKVQSPGVNNDIQPAIQSAVNSAVNGDIIELPAGQFVVNNNVLITKFVSIKGAGLGKTVLYRSESASDESLSNDENWRGIFRFNINSTASSKIVVSDITFKSKKPSLVDGDGLSLAEDIGVEMVRCVDFVITRCRFENFGNGAVSIYHDDDLASGLIFKNEFVHNCKGYNALGLGYGVVIYGVDKKWVDDPKFGSSNFIFVEDNLFDYHRHSIAAGGCALYVFRYNTVRNNVAGNTAHAIDAHEARLEGVENYYSSRAIEVYNNVIVNTTFLDGTTNCSNGTPIVAGKSPTWLTECAIRTRGGEALIHDNKIEGYRFGVGLITPKLSSTKSYPNFYQQGYLSALKYGANHTGIDGDKGSGDVFVWNDVYKAYSTSSQCVYFYNYSTDYIVADRDYHLFAKPSYTPYTYPHPLSILVTGIDSKGDTGMNQFKIYPNPASNGTINIRSEGAVQSGTMVEIIDSAGSTVKKVELSTNLFALNIQDLANGLYMFRITNSDQTFLDKIIIAN